MADEKKALAGIALVAVAAGVYIMYRGGGTSSVTLTERSVGNSYDPYVHWCHSAGGEWRHVYPQVIGATCLGEAIQEEDIGLAMRGVDVNGGYAQR